MEGVRLCASGKKGSGGLCRGNTGTYSEFYPHLPMHPFSNRHSLVDGKNIFLSATTANIYSHEKNPSLNPLRHPSTLSACESMISLLQSFYDLLTYEKTIGVLVVGEKGVGKSTLVDYILAFYRVNNELIDKDRMRPTVGCNTVKMRYKGTMVRFWDVGAALKRVWHQYYEDASVLSYMVDCSNPDAWPADKEVLIRLLENPVLQKRRWIIALNKMDLVEGNLLQGIVTEWQNFIEKAKQRYQQTRLDCKIIVISAWNGRHVDLYMQHIIANQ